MSKKNRKSLFPLFDECSDAMEWMEENNDVDRNRVVFRMREAEPNSAKYIITVEWRMRDRDDRPAASELLVLPGWVIDDWYWNGESWLCCIRRG